MTDIFLSDNSEDQARAKARGTFGATASFNPAERR